MRDQINTLKDERATLVEQMRAVTLAAEAEARDLTGEESQEFDRLEVRVGELTARADRMEKLGGYNQAEERQITPDAEDTGWEVAKATEAPKSFKEFNEQRAVSRPQDDPEYRQAFFKMVTARDMRELTGAELRALSKASAGAGLNLVPTAFEKTLIDSLRDFGVMRQIATVFTTTDGSTIQVPSVTTHGTASWTAENAAFTESDEVFGQPTLSAYKAATIMKVSDELLADAAFDLDSYIRNEFGLRIGVLENTAYQVGDGTGKPTGVTVTATAGKTGANGQTTSVITDDLFDLYHSVLPPYRRNGSWVMNDATIKAIRKLKDSTNQYLWQPGLAAGQPDTLLGRPVYADPDVAVMAASAESILFGDFSYYWIRDVQGVAFQRLQELYAANGQVGFRAYHRTDGKLLNAAAIKTYTNSAT